MLSVASNSFLVMFKAIAGALIVSVSIISEAIHSGMDLLAAVIAFFAVRKSHAPADKQHPFGHGKLESISGLVEAGLIFIAAVWIIFEAFKKFSTAGEVEQPGWGVAVMLVSAIVNIFVSRKLFVVGAETDSLALQADAWHLRTDVYTSAGVMGSLAIIWGGGYFFPGVSLGWLDPAAAVIVAVIIIIVTVLSLAFGDTSGGFRRLIQIVFGLSIAFAATSFFLAFFSFGGGALIG